MENQTVDILMAVYNGEKYIENQLLSLLQQKHKNWQLYIQDDGSTDSTLAIVKRYKDSDSRITIIENNVKKQGAGRNFLSMIEYSQSDYALFCDQDDIWLENKISDMVSFANSKNMNATSVPGIIYADGYAFSDESGDIDFGGISHNHARRLNDFLFFNSGYQGCSILMNKPLKDLVANYSGFIYLHDDIVSLVAHAFDNVYFLPKKLMLYRQHRGAVTGNKSFSQKGIFSKLLSVKYLISRKHYREKKEFYENYSQEISPENNKLLSQYLKFCVESSKLKKIIIIMRNDFTLGGSKIKLIVKTLVRKGFDSE